MGVPESTENHGCLSSSRSGPRTGSLGRRTASEACSRTALSRQRLSRSRKFLVDFVRVSLPHLPNKLAPFLNQQSREMCLLRRNRFKKSPLEQTPEYLFTSVAGILFRDFYRGHWHSKTGQRRLLQDSEKQQQLPLELGEKRERRDRECLARN
jgi:hypothetical protein